MCVAVVSCLHCRIVRYANCRLRYPFVEILGFNAAYSNANARLEKRIP